MPLTRRHVAWFLRFGIAGMALELLLLCSSVDAAPITIQFTGVIGNEGRTDLVAPGSHFSGTYSYEYPTADNGIPGSLTALNVTLAGNAYHALPTPDRNYIGAVSPGPNWYIVETVGGSFDGPGISGNHLWSFRTELTDNFNFDHNPYVSPPSLGSLLTNSVHFGFFSTLPNVPTGQDVIGSLTSLAPVPLPGTLLLFGSGLIGLMGLKARRSQRRA